VDVIVRPERNMATRDRTRGEWRDVEQEMRRAGYKCSWRQMEVTA